MAFVTGAIVMSFEMLGSRYLNPYFGSGIYTWASLISTVLGALTVGYFIGGWLADRVPSVTVLGITVMIGSLYMLVLPASRSRCWSGCWRGSTTSRSGSLLASMAILFFPVTFFGMYSPFAIRLMLRSAARSGTVSGAVYGISTIGSIAGTLGTTFFLLPSMGSRTLTLTLGAIGAASALVLIALPWLARRHAATAAFALTALLCCAARGTPQALVDEQARAELLKRPDGRIARIETEFNDIFITKRRNQLTMSFQLKGWDYTESVTNLRDPDDLPVHYTRFMPLALAYPETPAKILMIGLGGGSISTYLGRAMPDVTIDTVEIDPGVINAAKRYFGIVENAAGEISRRRRPRVPQPQQAALRPDPGRCVPRRLCAVSPADQGILHPDQAAAGAGRRRCIQRARRHQALCLDDQDAQRGVPRRRTSIRPAKAR